MRMHFSSSAFREHRLLYQMNAPSESTVQQPSEDPDVRWMDQRLENLLSRTRSELNVTLSADRRSAIDRQRLLIRDRLLSIREISTKNRQAYQNERARLLGEIESLMSYARYQAEQQRENEGRNGQHNWQELQGVSVEEDRSGRKLLWVEARRSETVQFTYVSRNPQISRVLGVMTVAPNTVNISMPNAFLGQRTTYQGREYFVLTPDARFDGTFTIYKNGQRKSVDWQSAEAEQNTRLQRERDLNRELPTYNALIAEHASLTQELQAAIPTNDQPRIEQLNKSIQQLSTRIDAYRARLRSLGILP